MQDWLQDFCIFLTCKSRASWTLTQRWCWPLDYAAGSDLDFGLGIYSPNYSKRDDTIIRLLFEMEPKIFFEKWKLFTKKKKIHNSLALAASWKFVIILFLNSQQNCCCCLMLLGSQFENQNKSLMDDFYVIFLSWTSDFFNFWHWQSVNKIFFLYKLF